MDISTETELSNHLGTIRYQLHSGNYESAWHNCIELLKIFPESAEVNFNLALILCGLEQYRQSLEYFVKVHEEFKTRPEFYYNFGYAFQMLHEYESAYACYECALTLKNDYIEACENFSIVSLYLGLYEKAMQAAKFAVNLAPNRVNAHWNYALILLTLGDYSIGWHEYKWGLLNRERVIACAYEFPKWQGEQLTNSTILIGAEQGIGDQVMFASCLKSIIVLAKKVILQTDVRLVKFLQENFSTIEVIPTKQNLSERQIREINYFCYIGDLPRYFRKTKQDFITSRDSNLKANQNLTIKWQKIFSLLGTGLKIGISWWGGKNPKMQNIRSIDFGSLVTLFDLPGVNWINLQYGFSHEEVESLLVKYKVVLHQYPELNPLKELDNFLAAIFNLDMVISIDNSTVHFAGSLGIPTWVLLPLTHNWRWQVDREDCDWYPSIKLYRQKKALDWHEVIKCVKRDLQKN